MTDQDNNYKEWIKQNENKWIAGGIITGSIAIVTPIIIYFASGSTLSASSFEKLGTVGDFMGGTTVGLLSLTSILFLVSTLVMQRKELGMQREELELTRKELAKANKQYEITNETMLKQQFETTFFNLISMHKQLVNGIKHPSKNVLGNDLIKDFNNLVLEKYKIYEFRKFLISKFHTDKNSLYEGYLQAMVRGGRPVWGKPLGTLSEGEWEIAIGRIIAKEKSLGYKFEDVSITFDEFIKLYNDDSENIVYKTLSEFINTDNYRESSYTKAKEASGYKNVLNDYFNSLNVISYIITSSNLSNTDKGSYYSILCSQLTSNELSLIKYDALLNNNMLLKPVIIQLEKMDWVIELEENLWSY